jgi:hypothetical protein
MIGADSYTMLVATAMASHLKRERSRMMNVEHYCVAITYLQRKLPSLLPLFIVG